VDTLNKALVAAQWAATVAVQWVDTLNNKDMVEASLNKDMEASHNKASSNNLGRDLNTIMEVSTTEDNLTYLQVALTHLRHLCSNRLQLPSELQI
jgi:hypothetical protein